MSISPAIKLFLFLFGLLLLASTFISLFQKSSQEPKQARKSLLEGAVTASYKQSFINLSNTPRETTSSVEAIVEVDPFYLETETTFFSGRIERLLFTSPGEIIQKGEALAYVYSPQLNRLLITAQQVQKGEEVLKENFAASLAALKRWGYEKETVLSLLSKTEIREDSIVPYFSTVSGRLYRAYKKDGEHFMRGAKLLSVYEKNAVRIKTSLGFELYPHIKEGAYELVFPKPIKNQKTKAKNTLSFKAIHPQADPKKREFSLILTPSPKQILEHQLYPGKFLLLEIKLSALLGRTWAVPNSAVLDTGERELVFIAHRFSQGYFYEMKEIESGASLNDWQWVYGNFDGQENIVLDANFRFDSSSQILSPSDSATLILRESLDLEIKDPSVDDWLPVYLELTRLLSQDNYSDAQLSVNKLEKVFRSLEEKPGPEMRRVLFQAFAPLARASINKETGPSELFLQGYKRFSDVLTVYLSRLSELPQGLNLFYCPMADGNQGGTWLSKASEVENPYFGSQMFSCGEKRSSLLALKEARYGDTSE